MGLPIIPHLSGSLRSNTTPCWPRPVSIIIRETTMNWEPLAENISVFAHSQSLIPEILISFGQCPKERHKKVNKSFKKNNKKKKKNTTPQKKKKKKKKKK